MTDRPQYRVFISWSGDRSRAYAAALHAWLPFVVPDAYPWMSQEIEAGQRWDIEIQAALKACSFGIICCTPRSLTSQWLMFEAGAVANAFSEPGGGQGRVVPYLVDLPADALRNTPLQAFQHVTANKAGTLSLLKSLVAAIKSSVEVARLEQLLSRQWPDLEKSFNSAPKDDLAVRLPAASMPDDIAEIKRWMAQISRQLSALHPPAADGGDGPDYLEALRFLKILAPHARGEAED
jgi:hypothetical protein